MGNRLKLVSRAHIPCGLVANDRPVRDGEQVHILSLPLPGVASVTRLLAAGLCMLAGGWVGRDPSTYMMGAAASACFDV